MWVLAARAVYWYLFVYAIYRTWYKYIARAASAHIVERASSWCLRPGLPKWCHSRIILFFAYVCINVSSIGIRNKTDTVTGYFSPGEGHTLARFTWAPMGNTDLNLYVSRNSAFSPKLHPRRFLKTNIVSTNVWRVYQFNKSSWQRASIYQYRKISK